MLSRWITLSHRVFHMVCTEDETTILKKCSFLYSLWLFWDLKVGEVHAKIDNILGLHHGISRCSSSSLVSSQISFCPGDEHSVNM